MRITVLVIGLFLLAGCAKRDHQADQFKPDADELVAAISINPATLDPALSQDTITNDLMLHVFEGLVGWSADSKIVPKLAENWDISTDGRTYTFHLREARFHNGDFISAGDVLASWERAARKEISSPVVDNYLGDIEGMKDLIEGKAGHLRGVEIVKDRVLRVRLVAPRASFLGKLTYPTAAVLPAGTGLIRDAKQMIGTGPYRVVSYTPEAEIKLTRFDQHYEQPPVIERLTYRVIKDPATRLAQFRTGRLDWTGLSQQDYLGMQGDPNILFAARPATFYVGMNGTVYPPFADRRVRQAFNHAIDRRRLVEDVLGYLGVPAEGILPDAVPQLKRNKPALDFDVARAKSLLRESGWEGKLPPLELWVSDSQGDRRRSAELVVSMLREHLAVPIKMKLVEASVVIQKATRRELGFFFGSWYADYLDPENFLSVLLSSYGQNRTNWDNPEFTRLCREADSMPDGSARLEAYAKAEDIALVDAPWIPLYHPREAVAMHPGLKGLESNAFGLMPPVNVRR